jgi:hypothetical protein
VIHAVAAFEFSGAAVIRPAAEEAAGSGLVFDAESLHDRGRVEHHVRHELRAAAHVQEDLDLTVRRDVAVEPRELGGGDEQVARFRHAVVKALVVGLVVPEALVADRVDEAVRVDLRRLDAAEVRTDALELDVARQQTTLFHLGIHGRVEAAELGQPLTRQARRGALFCEVVREEN